MKNSKKVYIPTFGEEVGNTISHGVMMVATLLALPFSAVWAYIHGDITGALGVSIFVLSIFSMFTASTLYHSMQPDSKHKAVFHILDHIFIYVAIAGSYTPVALYVIGGWQGIAITAIQWTMVLFGIFYKSLSHHSIPAVSLTIYFVMGWMVVFSLSKFVRNASVPLLALIVAGGLLYSIGAIFYAKKGFKYHHLVWHIFIDLAAICHFVGIVFYLY